MNSSEEHSYFVISDGYNEREVKTVVYENLPKSVQQATRPVGDLIYAINQEPFSAPDNPEGVAEVEVGGIDTGLREEDGPIRRAEVLALNQFGVRGDVEEFILDRMSEDLDSEKFNYIGEDDPKKVSNKITVV